MVRRQMLKSETSHIFNKFIIIDLIDSLKRYTAIAADTG